MIKIPHTLSLYASVILLCYACNDKEDVVKINEFTANIKVVDFDTNQPIPNVGIDFFITNNNDPNSSPEKINKTTNSNGEVIQSLQDKANQSCSFEAGYNSYIEVDNNDFILYRPNRIIVDNAGNKMLSHTLKLLEGGRFSLEVPVEAINAKDTIAFDIYQIHKGKKLAVSFAKIPLALFEKDLSLAKFPAGFIADEKIYFNYRFSNKGIQQKDTLQLSKGGTERYTFKY
jgi:hypothetical protein